MNKGLFSKLLPHLIAVVIFLIVAVIYCKPVLDGKVVNQSDVIGWKGMAQQSFEFKEKYGHFPLWTNSLFSGMPAFAVALDASHSVSIGYIYSILTLGLPKPIHFFFLACICFYFLSQVLRVNPWIGVLAALSYAYATYNPVIISVGHDTKMQAIGLMPAVIASLLLLFQRKYLWGLALLSIFFGLQIGTQHLQVVYYTAIIMGFISFAYLVHSIRQKEIKQFSISISLAIAAGIVGFFTYAVATLTFKEYAQETMRGGKSELTTPQNLKNKTEGGLDKDYAFQYSYGISEILTVIVPGIYGGSSGGKEFSGSTKFTEALSNVGVPEDQAAQMANGYSYWGEQPIVAGPIYFGAIICFLFVLGLVNLRGWNRWWIIGATIFGFILAWGKNFAAINYLLFDYLPYYNKFRAPSMALVIPQLIFPLTASLAVHQFLFAEEKKEQRWKNLKLATYITAGIFVLLGALYVSFDYKGGNDAAIRDNFVSALSQGQQANPQAQATGQTLMNALQDDRQSHYGGDLMRSFLLIALSVLLLGAFYKNKVKPSAVIAGLLLLSSFDLLSVGRRYLNDDTFVEPEQFEAALQPSEADRQLISDPNKPFRVFDQTGDPFNSSRASYFHNSIGGYHPAKLGLYQDLIEQQLAKGNMQVYNMLNTRYFLVSNPANGQPAAQQNPAAFGPAWFVKSAKFVPSADLEMAALNNTSLKDTVIIRDQFKGEVQPFSFDSAAKISVSNYNNDTIRYQTSANSTQLIVFSEIYYPLGWNVYIDGKKSKYIKANYLLRAMHVPAGNHTIEFIFEPESYKTGNTLMMISSLIAYMFLIAAIAFEVIRRKKPTEKKA